ncbi:unnamed protein product [Adineta steineri]|uniref:Nuclear transport factor 2 family protein n=1 Tax=Adineta steineri TaxID=433720 RepID=A0A815PWU7_9BILA|nr:unnamed protein product [Adineta steineri]
MTTYALLSEYLSAYNQHDVNKIIDFLHPNCRVIFNDQIVLQGVDAMRPTYEHDFLNPNASATIIEHNQDLDEQDRIRVVLKTNDNRLIDVTYVFETKENDDKIHRKKMIEHIIHSLKFL